MKSSTAVLQVATPEGVSFALPLAGPVTRAVALFIDFAVGMALQLALSIASQKLGMLFSDLAGLMQMVASFIIAFGYSTFCELIFGGQTVGKRVMRIRVVDERGLRLRPAQVLIRNLLRLVDMFPMFYAVGGAFALFSRRCQRLGDLAAGTVVVRIVQVAAPDVESVLGGKYNSFRQHPHLEARLRRKVSSDEARLALAALVRRDEFEPAAAVKIFSELAARFRELVRFPEEVEFGITDEQYVRNVVDTLYRSAKKT